MSNRELVFYLNPRGDQRREILRLLADAGIRRIGIDGCSWPPERQEDETERFRLELRECGMAITSMHALPPLRATAAQEPPPSLWDALLSDLGRLAALGGQTAVYHACFLRDVAPEGIDAAVEAAGWDAFADRSATTLRRLAKQAARFGISVVLENVWHSVHARSVAGFIDIVRAADQPNVGICLDSGHANLAGLSVGDEIRAAGKLLRDTHFHDNVGPRDGKLFDQHIPPGLGTIDWQDACRALDEIGYPGPVVFEGVLGPGDSIEKGRFGGKLSHKDLIEITIRNWRAFEALAEQPA